VGIGTYNSGPNTLTRTTVLQSTNADALVNFGVGTKSVFISQPADKAVYLDASDNLTLVGPDVFVTGGDVTITGETHTRGIAIQNANGLYNDGGDTGYLTAAGGDNTTAGGSWTMYGPTHATKASDIEFSSPSYSGANIRLHWDYSSLTWDFKASKILTTGTLTSGPHFITEQAAADADVAGDGQFWVRNDAPNLPMFTDDAGTDFGLLTTHLMYAISDETTDLTVADDKLNIRLPHGLYLTEVRASCNAAPTGATLIFDIEEGGTTVLSTLLTIDTGETTSTTAAVPAVISDPNLADDAVISFNIDQIGSSVAGTGAKITLIGYRTT
jgi:hypothetical protein